MCPVQTFWHVPQLILIPRHLIQKLWSWILSLFLKNKIRGHFKKCSPSWHLELNFLIKSHNIYQKMKRTIRFQITPMVVLLCLTCTLHSHLSTLALQSDQLTSCLTNWQSQTYKKSLGLKHLDSKWVWKCARKFCLRKKNIYIYCYECSTHLLSCVCITHCSHAFVWFHVCLFIMLPFLYKQLHLLFYALKAYLEICKNRLCTRCISWVTLFCTQGNGLLKMDCVYFMMTKTWWIV